MFAFDCETQFVHVPITRFAHVGDGQHHMTDFGHLFGPHYVSAFSTVILIG